MPQRKPNKSYLLTVEGETELCYVKHLQKLINQSDQITCTVTFEVRVCKKPEDAIKKHNRIRNQTVYHLVDHEGSSGEFCAVLDGMDRAKKKNGLKQYELAYTNLSFELWVLLHKCPFMKSFTKQEKYLEYINKTFDTNFENMRAYKEKSGFEKVLSKITLDDVCNAVRNAEDLMEQTSKNHKVKQHGKYLYYDDNPSLSLHKFIKEVLTECGIKISK